MQLNNQQKTQECLSSSDPQQTFKIQELYNIISALNSTVQLSGLDQYNYQKDIRTIQTDIQRLDQQIQNGSFIKFQFLQKIPQNWEFITNGLIHQQNQNQYELVLGPQYFNVSSTSELQAHFQGHFATQLPCTNFDGRIFLNDTFANQRREGNLIGSQIPDWIPFSFSYYTIIQEGYYKLEFRLVGCDNGNKLHMSGIKMTLKIIENINIIQQIIV